jgi:Tol biopolymer transport system component/DNA-binding winged helix-turn-helix (wHTH) protein
MQNFTIRTPARWRFGVFEADLAARLLFKRGIRIKLQDKPFEILLALLEKQGEYVTREEFCERLWPNLAPADANRNLNKAMNKLRVALGDSSENPRFIETKPRLGYRFLATVEAIEETPALPASLATEASPIQVGLAASGPNRAPGRPVAWRRSALIGGAMLVAVATLLTVLLMARAPEVPQVAGTRQITNDAHQKVGPLATDGRNVYFSEFRNGRVVLAQAPASGGETRVIDTPFEARDSVFVLDVTRDGAELLVRTASGVAPEESAGPLWILSPVTGAARRLGDWSVHDARWSPDRRRLAFIVADRLFIAAGDGSGARQIAARPEPSNGDLVWSPDGRRIRFRSGFPGRSHTTIWEANPETGELAPVFPDWDYEQQFGEWTPDGKFFILHSPTDFRLWLAAEGWRSLAGRSRLTPLTPGPVRFRRSRIAPSGRTLFAMGEMARGELLRWDAAGRRFLPYRAGLSADQLDFSRDGRWVAYVSYPEGILWRSQTDGAGRLQLTFPPMQVYLPRYSPNATQIAFMGRLPHARWKIYLVPSDGGTPRQLLPGEGPEADPNWSPGGEQLAFAPFPWEVPLEQTGIRILDLNTGKVSTLPGSQSLFSPRWSPDGRYLVALHRDGTPRLFDFKAGAWVWSQPPPIQGGFPAWSRDGRFVYLFHAYTEERGIYRVQIGSRRVEKVASLLGIDVAGLLGPYGLSLAPDDSPIILRDLGINEIFALDLE